jgi:hypothetical protein
MAIGSGLSGSAGFGTEATYGTYQAPDRFLECTKVALKKTKQTKQSTGLAAGRAVPLASRRVVTTKAAGGSIDLEVANKNMGRLFNNLFGGTVAPVQQGATTAYLQSHNLAPTVDNAGKFQSIQAGVPDLTGVVRPYTFLGSKLTALEFSCGVDELLMCTATVDARDVDEGQTLVAPSYATGTRPFHFGQASVKVAATVGAVAAIQGVRKLSVKIERPQDTGRYYFGNGGLKSEPVSNNFVVISGQIDHDYVDKTIFADRYASDGQFALVWEFLGANIASTYYETFRITLPALFLDNDPPDVEGPDIVKTSYKFTGLYDGTNNPLLLEYMSTDTTL